MKSLKALTRYSIVIFTVTMISVFSHNLRADSPANLSTDIDWTDTGGTASARTASFSGVTDIMAAFNHARRQEEIQLSLAANTIPDLALPAQATWDGMSDDAKALYILNDERTSRVGIAANVIGLPFAGVESAIDLIAENYGILLHDTDTRGHYQPSGDSALNGPTKRIEQDATIGSKHSADIVYTTGNPSTHTDNSAHFYGDTYNGNGACHEFIARSENLAYFAAYSSGVLDASSVPLPLERSIYNWIYADAGSNWGHREAALLQDETLAQQGSGWGFNNNNGSADHEGFIGVHVIGSTGYEPFTIPTNPSTGTPFNNYGVAVVLNIFDSLSDASATSLGCNYNVSLRTEDLPQPSAPTQTIEPSQSSFEVLPDNTVEFTVILPEGNPEASGLGITVYFDSSKLTFLDITNVLSTPNLSQTQPPTSDVADDGDGNPNTNQKIVVAFANFSSTPFVATADMPANLFTLRFSVNSDFATQSVINFTGSPAAGFDFASTPVTVSLAEDTENPTITAPADTTIEATGTTTSVADAALGTATAADNVDANPTVTHSDTTALVLGANTVIWTATDAANNSATDNQIITIADTTAPTITAPADVSAATTGATTAVTLGSPTVSDLVDSSPTATPDTTGPFAVGVHTVTWTATDASGNSSTDTQTVTISADTENPTITAPADTTIEATGTTTSVADAALGTATAADNVDASPTVTHSATTALVLGANTVVWTATDAAGNSATDNQIVTIADTTAPTITAPADVSAATTGATTAVTLGSPTVSDLVDSSPTVTPDITGPFAVGVHTVTWTATDANGNSSTDTQTVTISADTENPTITAPTDKTIEATGTTTSVADAVLGTATAADNVDANPTVTHSDTTALVLGANTVIWTATDAAGNSVTDNQIVTIADTTAPTITAPADVTAATTGATTSVTLGSPTVSDLVDSSPTVTPDITGPFAVGVHTVTWTATDASGNSSTDTQTVTITASVVSNCAGYSADSGEGLALCGCSNSDDETISQIARLSEEIEEFVPGNVLPESLIELPGLTNITQCIDASDTTCDSVIDPDNSAGRHYYKNTLGTDDYFSCLWTPDMGYSSGAAHTPVVDGDPTIAAPADTTVEATGITTSVSDADLGTPTASDDVDQNPTVTHSDTSALGLGEHTVTWTVTDSADNTATDTQTVTVVDTTAPSITAPADITVATTGALTAVTLGTPVVSDLVDSSPTAVPSPSGPFAVGMHTVTWTASDAEGNESTDTQTVTITDTVDPIADINVLNSASAGTGNASLSVPHDLLAGTNRVVVVGASIETNGSEGRVTSISYGGVTMHPITDSFASITTNGSYNMTTELFYLLESELPVSGSTVLDITHSGDNISAGVTLLEGVQQITPNAAVTNTQSNTSSISTLIATQNANSLIVDVIGGGHPQNRGIFQNGSAQTESWNANAPSSQGAASTYATDAAGSYTVSWDWLRNGSGLNRASHSVAAFAPASGGVEPTNQAPVLAVIEDLTVTEGTNTKVDLSATDADGDSLQFDGVNIPAFVTLIDNSDGTASLAIAPQMGDAGSYTVTINVTDGELTDTQNFELEVVGVEENQPPVLSSIGDSSVAEDGVLSINLSATDPDGDAVSFSSSTLPSFMALTDNNDGTATLEVTPVTGDAGSYPISINVTDGEFTDNEDITITVSEVVTPGDGIQVLNSASAGTGSSSVNIPHDLLAGTNRAVVVGASIETRGSDGRVTSISYGGVTMHPITDSFAVLATGRFRITTELFYLLENELPASGNTALNITHSGDDISAGVTLLEGVQQIEPNTAVINTQANPSTISTQITTQSANSVIVDVIGGGHDQGRGIFQSDSLQTETWTADAPSSQGAASTYATGAAGNYTVSWDWLQNGSGLNRAAHSVAAFAPADGGVEPGNQAPVLATVADQSVQEGSTLTIDLSATDADGDSLQITASSTLPDFMTLTDHADGTAELVITPSVGDVGNYPVTINVSDGELSDSQSFVVTVTEIVIPGDGIEVLNSASGGTGSSSVSIAHDLLSGANRVVVVGASIETNGSEGRVTSITYAGVTMHPIMDSFASITTNGSYNMTTELFYLLESELPSVTSTTLDITHNGDNISAGVTLLQGVEQTAPNTAVTNSQSNSSSISTEITTQSANSLIVDVIGGGHPQNRGIFQNGSMQTQSWEANAPSSQGAASTYAVGAAGSYSVSWDWLRNGSGLNRAAHSIAAFAPAGGELE